ncbi:uncharacterized protein LOC134671871 [Cydia fagiglandana]|uniref:uncharacterized protein LOC134671871 n=1 Tax=Cydia fagiglandana TaxID=1458189 RepID=UPI002FEE1865
MDYRLTILVCIVFFALVSASPVREKRDIMESMKGAWNDMVKTLSDASDAVVHVFKPTERSIVNKMADGMKDLTN